ncbi:MAG TPA: hypothetical protein VNV36_05405 [Pseudomonas sp.]|uniref:hypothetical protein n=1 Tax=Pseudomonas sp. TaxID=306 RepID=UPI002C41D6AD|nr:hypothetical protein [Pseudomonas sp.]HWH86199.1 hypothetical protein [Pseudomonas sp.]
MSRNEMVSVPRDLIERAFGINLRVSVEARKELRALLAAPVVERQEPVAYRYKEGHASWENEKPWEPTTVAHSAVLLERKALAANGTFKGDERDYYLALTVEPLYTSPPAPVAVEPEGWKLVPVSPTAEMLRAVDDEASDKHLARGRAISAWVLMLDAAPTAPVAVMHPFAEKVISKLRRFEECASDFEAGGVDIGRHWLDLLTQLGLLSRVQRSPALWEITQQGEACLDEKKRINNIQRC